MTGDHAASLLDRLGPAVTRQLEGLRRRGWALHRWTPDVDEPAEVIGAALMWDDGAADVVVLRSHLMGAAYRAMPCRDVFEPISVTLYTMATPTRVLDDVVLWEPYGEESVRRESVRPPGGLVLPAPIRRRYVHMIDMPHTTDPIVVPPYYRTT